MIISGTNDSVKGTISYDVEDEKATFKFPTDLQVWEIT
jgi:hypothetical protein